MFHFFYIFVPEIVPYNVLNFIIMSVLGISNVKKVGPIKVICTQGFYNCLMDLVFSIRASELSGEVLDGIDLKLLFDTWLSFLKSDSIVINNKI